MDSNAIFFSVYIGVAFSVDLLFNSPITFLGSFEFIVELGLVESTGYEIRATQYPSFATEPAPVPEPSIFALIAAGFLGIGFARRRQY